MSHSIPQGILPERPSLTTNFPEVIGAAMTLRSPRERFIQACAYETCGFLLSVPLYLFLAGGGVQDAVALMAALAVAEALWAPFHDTVFDRLDRRLSGRVASARPQCWRVVHAVSHEASTILVTVPLLVWMGGHGWTEALLLDLWLTLACVGYAYLFHLTYDTLRPVVPQTVRPFCLAS
jgi:uncharacterized membrane protein